MLILNNYMSLNVLKDTILYARLCVTKNCPKFATCNERLNFMNCEHPYPLIGKAIKFRIYECVKLKFVDSILFLYLCTT